jgi:hypothetical protein
MNEKKSSIHLIIFDVVIVGLLVFILISNSGQYFSFALKKSYFEDAETEAFYDESVKKYENDKYKFSLFYPKEYELITFEQGRVDVILIRQRGSDLDLQINISPFGENITKITPDRVKRDLPDLEVINPQEMKISRGKVDALIFNSGEDELDNKVEVWFVHRGRLYQISTYESLVDLSKIVLESINFIQ